MRRNTGTRTVLLAGVAAIALGAGAGGAYAADAKVVTNKGGDKVKLSFSGQFTRQLHYLDDGGSERFRHEDSNMSSSRIRFHADGKIDADLSVGGLLEVGVDDVRNGGVRNVGANEGRSGNDFQTRIAEIQLKHKAFGKLLIGSGNAAANGIMNTNTNGSFGWISTATGLVFGNNTQFRNKSDGSLSGISAFQVFPDFDFSSRQSRIRYDSPVLFGFMASVSQSDNQTAEAALRWGGTILDTKIKAGAGYTDGSLNRNSGAANATFGGAGGAKNGKFYGFQFGGTHSSGIGANVIYGVLDRDSGEGEVITANARTFEAQLHYGKKFTELGKTLVVGEWVRTENMAQTSGIGRSWSVGLAQDIDAAAMNTYLRFTQAGLQAPGVNVDDMDLVTLGVRLKF